MSEEITADSLLTIATQANLAREAQVSAALGTAFSSALRHCKRIADMGKTSARFKGSLGGLHPLEIEALQRNEEAYVERMKVLGFVVTVHMTRGIPSTWEMVVDWTNPKK